MKNKNADSLICFRVLHSNHPLPYLSLFSAVSAVSFLIFITKLGAVDSSIIVSSIVRISPVLYISGAADIADLEIEQNRGEISPGSRPPWAVVIRPAIPAATVKIEVVGPVINQVIRDSNCNIHIKIR
jgi:hypothetical protein